MNNDQARDFVNAAADTPASVCKDCSFALAGFDAALAEILNWTGCAATQLASLSGLASRCDVGKVRYRDQRSRFGQGNFRALSGTYTLANLLRHNVTAMRGLACVSSREVLSGALHDLIAQAAVACATDSNHSCSMAWGAQPSASLCAS